MLGGPCQNSRKPVLVTERDQGFGLLPNCPCLAQELMEHGIKDPDMSRAPMVINLLHQGQRFATPLQRLIRIPEQPQNASQKGETIYTDIHSTVLLRKIPHYH